MVFLDPYKLIQLSNFTQSCMKTLYINQQKKSKKQGDYPFIHSYKNFQAPQEKFLLNISYFIQ